MRPVRRLLAALALLPTLGGTPTAALAQPFAKAPVDPCIEFVARLPNVKAALCRAAQLKPTSGQATIGGVPFAKIASPARSVGAVGDRALPVEVGRRVPRRRVSCRRRAFPSARSETTPYLSR